MKKFLLFIGLALAFYGKAYATTNCDIANGSSESTIGAAIVAASTNTCTVSAPNVPNGSTVYLEPGNYTWTSTYALPCGSNQYTITGPVVPLAPVSFGGNSGHFAWKASVVQPTVHVTDTFAQNYTFTYPNNCSANGPIIQYVEWDGGRPSAASRGGGGFLFVGYNVHNMVIQYNYIHGFSAFIPDPTYSNVPEYTGAIVFNGFDNQTAGYPTAVNDTVQWNLIGAIDGGDCEPVMELYQYYADNQGDGNMDSRGAQCGVVGFFTSTQNFVLSNNVSYHVEQGNKGYEGSGNSPYYTLLHNNFVMQYNTIIQYHRIASEWQDQPHTTMLADSNYIGDQWYGGYGSWPISWPMSGGACGASGPSNCAGGKAGDGYSNRTNNVIIANSTPPAVAATAQNCWQYATTWNSGTTYGAGAGVKNSSGQGYYVKNGVSSVPAGTPLTNTSYWTSGCYSGNNVGGFFYPSCDEFGGNGTSSHQLCQGQWRGYQAFTFFTNNPTTATIQYTICQETAGSTCTVNPEPGLTQSQQPVVSNSQFGTTVSTLTSGAPSISISGNTVTITSNGYTGNTLGPLGNTSAWYTTDGSTPVPQQSTFCGYSCSFSAANGTTVNAIAMWGARNQPYPHPSGFGFVPSRVVSAKVTGGTTPTLTGVTLTLQGGGNSVTVGNSVQACATLNYSGSISTAAICGSGTDVYGNGPSGWTSSNTTDASIGSTGNVTGLAVGSSNLTVQAKQGSTTVTSPNFGLTISAQAPVIQSIAINCTNSIAIGQAGSCTCLGSYTGPTTGSCPTTTWTSAQPSIATVNSSTGALLGIAQGVATITGSAGGFSASSTVNVTSNTPPAATVTSTAVTCDPNYAFIGATQQCQATAYYSDGTQTNCTTTDAQGTLCGGWTSSSPSVATVTSTGLATGEAVGTTNIGVTTPSVSTVAQQFAVAAPAAANVLGNTQYNLAGTTFSNYINGTYAVSPSSATSSVSSCSFYLPTGYTYTAGKLWDCGIVLAPSGTTQASSWTCHATYTTFGTNQDIGWHTLPLNGCGTLPASTAYWIAVDTNESGPIGEGFWDCGSNTGGNTCTGSLPTSGNGTYNRMYVSATYGVYTGMSTTVNTGGGIPQGAQYVTLVTPKPTLVSGSLTTPGSATSIQIGQTIQLYAICNYSDGTSYLCSPSADVYGNTLTSITSSSPSTISVGAIGSAHPALLQAIQAGGAVISAVLTGGINAQSYAVTVTVNALPLPPVTPRQLAR